MEACVLHGFPAFLAIMRIVQRLGVVFMVAGVAWTAAAEERFEVAPFAGLRFGGSFVDGYTGKSYDVKAGLSYGMAIDLDVIGVEERVELLWSRQESSLSPNTPYDNQPLDLDVQVFQIGLTKDFGGSEKIRPFLSGLVGATLYDSGTDSDVYFSFGMIGGVKYVPLKNVALRLDLRGYGTVVSGSGSAIFGGNGALITFSGDLFWQGEITASVVVRF